MERSVYWLEGGFLFLESNLVSDSWARWKRKTWLQFQEKIMATHLRSWLYRSQGSYTS